MSGAATVFGDYDQAGLDREYDNMAKVPGAAALQQAWQDAGAEIRQQMSCLLSIPYGPHPRHRLDIFPAARRDAPVLLFIHGGYWRRGDRASVHMLAPAYVAAGIHFACLSYRLCPEVGIADIVADTRAGLAWLHDHADSFGGDPGRLFVAGHSAGGHLAATLCGTGGAPAGQLKGGCSISGLHDLEPIRRCFLNETLGLDAESARALSPVVRVREPPPGQDLPPLILAVGDREGPEYLRQRDDLAAALRAARQPVEPLLLQDRDHFTACEAFGDPHHPLCQAMLRLILAPILAAAPA